MPQAAALTSILLCDLVFTHGAGRPSLHVSIWVGGAEGPRGPSRVCPEGIVLAYSGGVDVALSVPPIPFQIRHGELRRRIRAGEFIVQDSPKLLLQVT